MIAGNHRIPLALLATIVWTVAILAPASAQEPGRQAIRELLEEPMALSFVPGEVIVKMKPTATALGSATLEAAGLAVEGQPTSGGEVLMRLASSTAAALTDADLATQTRTAVAELRQDPNVEYAQPNWILQIAATPSDALYGQQWHYFVNGSGAGESQGGINLPVAWDTTRGDPSLVVAVIDTGILPGHEDVSGSPNLAAGFDMIGDTFRANDGDGRDADPTDPGDAVRRGQCGAGEPTRDRSDSWHGTHVAGTVGVGHTDNALGVAGINWVTKVQAVRVLGRCGGTSADINDGIRWAAGLPVPGVPDNPTPAKVINMSLGADITCASAPATQAAINDAVAAGVTVVVAAGNSATDASNAMPAGCDNVITVAAGNLRGELVTRYSNYGSAVEIMAPGGDLATRRQHGVLSMVAPPTDYDFYNGTSMAAPHVAGVAALMLAEDPGLSPDDVLLRLQLNSLPRSPGQCPRGCGAGLLDADLWSDKLRLAPAGLALDNDESAELVARLVAGGAPLAGVTVTFQSSAGDVARVTASAVTDARGMATATVEGLSRGSATITAQATGRTAQVPVRVPSATLWELLLTAFLTTLWLRRRSRWAGDRL